MHAVILTPNFLDDAERMGLSRAEVDAIVDAVAKQPVDGDLMPGTGGARKQRIQGRGKGKSGGYRVITYLAERTYPSSF